MFKIGEFSKITQVSIRMLRYYDETGLLKPARIDEVNNYRFYDNEQISRLNRILFLRHFGFQVAEIKDFLDHWDDHFVLEHLQKREKIIEKELVQQQERLAKIKLAQKDIENQQINLHANVQIKSVPEYQVLTLRKILADHYCESELWFELGPVVKKHHISTTGETMAIFHDTDFREEEVDVEVCAVVESLAEEVEACKYRLLEAVDLMAYTMVTGPFSNINRSYLAFASWLSHHPQYQMAGANRQIVHRGPWNEENSENYLVEIQIPLKKKKIS
ncbi:DNA-binding transcriptional MerR regulator/predicted transcriptional regulator YdeE [Enterococcus sp. PF1-24]|nr:MerR family transcriptional regulator [Enterococcus sp. PF1-24]MDH6402510.1 DNA-binding transcriptional MerR regulator/predicted transcriptional regulator YdeE [Enterococcus sp. PF1-24]